MAEATLNDLNATLKEINKGIRDSSGESATSRAKAAEQAAERKTYDDAVLGTLKSIQETLGKNFKSISSGDKKTGGLLAGILGGLGAGIGAIGKAITKIGPKFVLGMGSLALGIGAFILGLGGAAKVAEFVGIDGSHLNTLVSNVFGAFTGVDLVAMGALITAGILIGKKKGGEKAVLTGMTAIGAGIGGFFLGIIAADGIAKLASMIKLDGSSLATLITNFTTAFTGTDGAGIETLGALVVAGSLIGITKSQKAVISGMGALGAGIAAFAAGLVAADAIAGLASWIKLDGTSLSTLLTNVETAFETTDASGIDNLGKLIVAGSLIGITKTQSAVISGMGAVGAGIAAFAAGLVAADAVAGIGKWLGLKGENIKKLMGNFVAAMEGQDGAGLKALGLLIVGGSAIGIIPGGEVAVISGMAAIGGGIAAFMGGLVLADWIAGLGGDSAGSNLKVLLTNVGEAVGGFVGGIGKGVFEQLKGIDAEKLVHLGKGIAGIGVGIAAFGAGKVLGVIGGVMEGLGSFFGVESPIDTIVRLSKDKDIDSKRLKELGEGIGPLGKGIAGFSGFSMEGGWIGDTDLEKFLDIITKISHKSVDLKADNLKAIGDGLLPLGNAMGGFANVDISKIVDTSVFGRSTLEIFFDLLAAEKLGKAADPEMMKRVAAGILPLGKSIKTFQGIDMATIVGNNWTPGKETSFESFMGVVEKATTKIKNPARLQEVATGVSALGYAMQTFKGIDSDKMDFADLFNSLDKGITLNVTSAATTSPIGEGGTIVNNDNRTITIQNAPQLTNITGLQFARTDKALAAG
tara:strand:- start:2833 stop:5247 length:2415 start_codon:yes stop_codon:yes gene_type:complete